MKDIKILKLVVFIMLLFNIVKGQDFCPADMQRKL